MKIRSVTSFLKGQPGGVISQKNLEKLAHFNLAIRQELSGSGYELQSLRCATNPFPEFLVPRSPKELVSDVQRIEKDLQSVGFDYISVGTVYPDVLELFPLIPAILANTSTVFATAQMVHPKTHQISMNAIRSAARIILELSTMDENGFTNLFFSALAQVPSGIPFLPAAYKSSAEDDLSFALAMESADLAVSAFANASSLQQAGEFYRLSIEKATHKLSALLSPLAKENGFEFLGFDFTPAPFILAERSAAGSLELLSGRTLGEISSVSAAAFLMSVLDSAEFKRSGFNGLMLPVLEDSILAQRVAEGKLTIKDLLLYSTVCGTGLDTVPLPGDITESQLCSILLDVASLSVRLNKPLTARLMPVPGKKAGEMTSFDFPFFTNTRVMSPQNEGLSGLFQTADSVSLIAR